MKICQVCAIDFTLYHFLLPLMEAQEKAGHEVVGICSDGPWIKKISQTNLRIKPIPISRNLNPISHWISYRHLLNVFQEEKFDIVHVHTPIAAFIGRLAAHRAGVKCIVYTAHGFYFHDHMAIWKQKIFIFLEKWAGKYTDFLFTQAQEDAISAKNLNLCPKGIVEAIGNGVNAKKFFPIESRDQGYLQLRGSLNTSSHDIVIMITGRLVAEKGYNELFSAMRGQNAILWVAGSRLSSDHALAVDTSNMPANVRLLGHREDIPELLRASDIFVLPSHREGMPRSIIEAMMVGLPVIATDIRGSREEVLPGETGLIVPVLDQAALAMAITTLVNDQELRKKMGIAGRKRALELYSEDKVIERQMAHLQLT